MSTLCIWFPDWPVQYHFVRCATSADRPLIVHGAPRQQGPDRPIVALCNRARSVGLRPGMPLAEGEAIWSRTAHGFPAPLFCSHDPLAEDRQLELLAQSCQQFSPHVSLERTHGAIRPGGCHTPCQALLLNVDRLAPLFGGEQKMLAAVSRDLAQRGYQTRLALAPTAGAAWALSHHGQLGHSLPVCLPDRYIRLVLAAGSWWVPASRLHHELVGLPVSALRIAQSQIDLLSQLGITQVGQLRKIPRDQLASRLGPALARQLDYAFGDQSEPLISSPQATSHHHTFSLTYPTKDASLLSRILEKSLEQLLAAMAVDNEGLLQLTCQLHSATGCHEVPLTLYRPSTNVPHILSLLELQLNQLRLSRPIEQIQLEATLTAALEQYQATLFLTGKQEEPIRGRCAPSSLVRLLDRLGSRLGTDRVLHPHLVAEAQPERCWQHHPADQPRRIRPVKLAPGTVRPLHLLPDPQPLVPHGTRNRTFPCSFIHGPRRYQVRHYWGPERIETGWWREAAIRRDYYRVELLSGHRFWIYRDLHQGSWFLHGEFS